MSGKPKFVFFKMLGCGHCVQFFNNPTEETSTWAKLLKDPEVSSKVDSILIEWGGVYGPDRQLLSIIPVPPEYDSIGPEGKGVTYGPFFYLHQDGKAQNGIEMRNVAREFSSMKKWILSNANTFTVRASAPQPSRPAATRVPLTKREPRPTPMVETGPSTPGKPQIFNQEKLQGLPLEVRTRLQGQHASAPQRDIVESEPKYVPVYQQQQKTSTPNLQPYVQALNNSSKNQGYQNSNDAAKFRQNQGMMVKSNVTLNKASEQPGGVQRKFIARNKRK